MRITSKTLLVMSPVFGVNLITGHVKFQINQHKINVFGNSVHKLRRLKALDGIKFCVLNKPLVWNW